MSCVTHARSLMRGMPCMSDLVYNIGRRRSVFILGENGRDDQQLSIGILSNTEHHMHWMPPLILIIYSRLDRNIQSVTEMLPLKRRGVCT